MRWCSSSWLIDTVLEVSNLKKVERAGVRYCRPERLSALFASPYMPATPIPKPFSAAMSEFLAGSAKRRPANSFSDDTSPAPSPLSMTPLKTPIW